MNASYEKLLSPITIGGHEIQNRVIMGSMHTGLEEEDSSMEKLAYFFEERARGGVGLIITGGIAPHWRGWVAPFAGKLTNSSEVEAHTRVTEAVHKYPSKIVMQILHAGRYSYHPFSVAPSRIKAPINPFRPWSPSTKGVVKIVQQFTQCAYLASEAGYDGVEIMGSEGYLINQFIASRTNKRRDRYGGSFENRCRFALEIVNGIRDKCPSDFIIVFRLSMLDLVEEGSTWEEVVLLAKKLEESGVSLINTGIGWHEARIPTIATCVPRGGYSWVTEKLKKEISLPLAAVNRINTPEKGEEILQKGSADFVTMARPFLADAEFVAKAARGESHLINTCIACNQACLDHIFKKKRASCLVNPRACFEKELQIVKTEEPRSVCVVGAGPAGLSAAVHAAERGFKVTLFEKGSEIGGQFNLARRIPGKEEFDETIRYYSEQIKKFAIDIKFGVEVTPDVISQNSFSHVAWASGVIPRRLSIPGIDGENVVPYDKAIREPENLGDHIVIIGAGGIGIDTATLLMAHKSFHPSKNSKDFNDFWGIDSQISHRGGLKEGVDIKPQRSISILYRSSGRPGTGLGKTTGWIHRSALKKEQVKFVGGVKYNRIDGKGIHFSKDDKDQFIACDQVVVCAGQESELRHWSNASWTVPVTLIGGAKDSRGIDAKRAIKDGIEWAISL